MVKPSVNKLENCSLWDSYLKKLNSSKIETPYKRRDNVISVYTQAVERLNKIPQHFSNYTLHEERHVLNVICAMGGLLGDWTERLSICEHELLILSAALHDIGMYYTNEELKYYSEDKQKLNRYLQKNLPWKIGKSFADLEEEQQQDYLRSLHATRFGDLKDFPETKEMFNKIDDSLFPEDFIIYVCKSHGEGEEFLKSDLLEYNSSFDCDLRFCALLLRLGDILDFDGSRAPKILLPFAKRFDRSVDAYQVHEASHGFSYPCNASDEPLAFYAECELPEIEHRLRSYLDWVDEELILATSLVRISNEKWSKFPFPRSVSRDGIISKGYDGIDSKITVDDENVINLLLGVNLYENPAVFVRELLQNSIDSTILREKMDSNFRKDIKRDTNMNEWAIHLSEWTDQQGQLWFRIDDNGTGMTRRMLQEYFLKVGNSYYSSKELRIEMANANNKKKTNYESISRFGIGFLSCFRCCTKVEVSTRHFDDEKCNRDNKPTSDFFDKWGLRLYISGLRNRYILRNQARGHLAEKFLIGAGNIDSFHGTDGYRIRNGTSILLAIDKEKLNGYSLETTAKSLVCATRMPIYYNGKRLGQTFDEVVKKARELAAKKVRIFELPDESRNKIAKIFSNLTGPYPKVIQTFTLFEQGLSGDQENKLSEEPRYPSFLVFGTRYRNARESDLLYKYKDQTYKINSYYYIREENPSDYATLNITLSTTNLICDWELSWSELKEQHNKRHIETLEIAFHRYNNCPSEEDLGECWLPFAQFHKLTHVWGAWVDFCVRERAESLGGLKVASVKKNLLSEFPENVALTNAISYRGIVAGTLPGVTETNRNKNNTATAFLLMEDGLRPLVDLGRQRIKSLPVEAALCIELLFQEMQCVIGGKREFGDNGYTTTFDEQPPQRWRSIRITPLGQWAEKLLGNMPEKWIGAVCGRNSSSAVRTYRRALLQEMELSVRYVSADIKKGQGTEEGYNNTKKFVNDFSSKVVWMDSNDNVVRIGTECGWANAEWGVSYKEQWKYRIIDDSINDYEEQQSVEDIREDQHSFDYFEYYEDMQRPYVFAWYKPNSGCWGMQKININGRRTKIDARFESLPSLMFCKAETMESRRILCFFTSSYEDCFLTEEHPFSQWLLNHAALLSEVYPAFLKEIVDAFTEGESDEIIKTVASLRVKLEKSSREMLQKLDLDDLPQLTKKDFWEN